MQSFKTAQYIKKTFWDIASHLDLSQYNENVDGQTNGRADRTQNLYTSASYGRVQLCKVSKLYDKTFWVIASHLELSHYNENVDGQTNGRVDGTQNLYTSASYGRVQLCKVSKLYDKNFLSYRITSWVISLQRKSWRTDERTGGRNPEFIHFCLLW